MATNNIVNYDDKRFAEVEADKKAALNEVDVTYGNMISDTDKYYKQQMDAVDNYAEQQKKFQQEQTDFAIEKIEQQKAQAKKDYTKEQSGAYVDWQKQSNQYGAKAEQMAAQGMQNTGYSESSQVSMYNTYQNRVATAREAVNRAYLEYDNMMKEARLQNNAALAEIAFNALKEKNTLALEGFQYKNTLIIAKSDKKQAIDSEYYGRYTDVLNQIYTEEGLALDREKFDYQKAQDAKKSSSGGGGSGGSGGGSGGSGRVKKYAAPTPTYKPVKGAKSGTTVAYDSKENKKNEGKLTIDMQSVLNLGRGPISAAELNKLVSSGLVMEYQSGNKLKYRYSPYVNKQSKLFK